MNTTVAVGSSSITFLHLAHTQIARSLRWYPPLPLPRDSDDGDDSTIASSMRSYVVSVIHKARPAPNSCKALSTSSEKRRLSRNHVRAVVSAAIHTTTQAIAARDSAESSAAEDRAGRATAGARAEAAEQRCSSFASSNTRLQNQLSGERSYARTQKSAVNRGISSAHSRTTALAANLAASTTTTTHLQNTLSGERSYARSQKSAANRAIVDTINTAHSRVSTLSANLAASTTRQQNQLSGERSYARTQLARADAAEAKAAAAEDKLAEHIAARVADQKAAATDRAAKTRLQNERSGEARYACTLERQKAAAER